MSSSFGATIVGIKAKDGVVIASDKRISYGGFIASRNARKIFLVNKRAAAAFAGLYGDVGGLMRILEAELRAYETLHETEASVRFIAKRLSTIMYSYKFFPFFVEVLVGGVEKTGEPKLYVLDPLGSILEEEYAAAGTGSSIAFGILEERYKSDMSVDEAENLAITSMRAAIGRDASSGDGIDVVTLKKGGVRERTITLRLVEG